MLRRAPTPPANRTPGASRRRGHGPRQWRRDLWAAKERPGDLPQRSFFGRFSLTGQLTPGRTRAPAARGRRGSEQAERKMFEWSEWRDSNPRPLVPQTSALTGLRYTPTAPLIGAGGAAGNAPAANFGSRRLRTGLTENSLGLADLGENAAQRGDVVCRQARRGGADGAPRRRRRRFGFDGGRRSGAKSPPHASSAAKESAGPNGSRASKTAVATFCTPCSLNSFCTPLIV